MFTTTSTRRTATAATASLRSLLAAPRRAALSQLQQQHRAISHLPTECPNCGAPLPSRLPSCRKCWHIADIPSDELYHDILDLPSGPNPFKLDIKLLRHNFLKAQTACHPDVWAGRGETYRLLAERLSSRINEAYKTLQGPIPRAQYLLQGVGLSIQEEEPLEDFEALSEVMETMEDIDDAHDPSVLDHIRKVNEGRMMETVEVLEKTFEAGNHQEARAALVRLVYWERIERAVKDKLEKSR